MEQLYTAVLTFSAFLASAIFMRLRQRVGVLFGLGEAPIAPLVALPGIAFLVVVAAPGPLLVGALLLAFAGWRYDHRPFSLRTALVLTFIAVALATWGLHAWPALPIPRPALIALIAACWFAFTVSASSAPQGFEMFTLIYMLALLPLSLAPAVGVAPGFIALDAAILEGALLGALLFARGPHAAGAGLNMPYTLLLGFLVLRTFIGGGWMFALTSLLLWAAGLIWARTSEESHAAA